MRTFTRSLFAFVMVALAVGNVVFRRRWHPHARVTEPEYERWTKELSNWGRWGKDDQIGALNLITPSKRRQAAGLVKDGFSVSLAADVDTVKAVDNPNPYEHTMLAIGSDRLAVSYHGIAHTHLDSLAHINANGVFYNGYTPDADAVLKQGHARNSIHNVKNGIVTRGILIDIPRLKGVPYLEPGTPIYVEDLEAWEKKAGVKVSAGDALFVRTRRVGPPEGGGAMASRQGRRRQIGGTRSIRDPVVETARHRDTGQRPSAIRLPVESPRSGSRFCVAVPGRTPVRQLRPRGPRRCGGRTEPVGVSADGGSAADSGRVPARR